MKRLTINRLLILVTAFTMAFGFTGCKSKKKLAEEQARKEMLEKTANAKATLNEILNKSYASLDELEADEQKLRDIKGMNLLDEEALTLIAQVEDKLSADRKALEEKEAAEAAKRAEEERLAKIREQMASKENQDINGYLDRILGAGNTPQANNMINDALKLFASPEAPVLIEIYNDGDIVDYDKPTTAQKYLHYLKDVKRKPDAVKEFKKNDAGKITELVLTKIKY
ncbi:hypothetical protein V6R21_17170 [Limibacter armeniacum]|uniref:hypothetical protein n=1 Tax=Limibacter armeniacum TaxID=466084 RepID=UPI002FE56020